MCKMGLIVELKEGSEFDIRQGRKCKGWSLEAELLRRTTRNLGVGLYIRVSNRVWIEGLRQYYLDLMGQGGIC